MCICHKLPLLILTYIYLELYLISTVILSIYLFMEPCIRKSFEITNVLEVKNMWSIRIYNQFEVEFHFDKIQTVFLPCRLQSVPCNWLYLHVHNLVHLINCNIQVPISNCCHLVNQPSHYIMLQHYQMIIKCRS